MYDMSLFINAIRIRLADLKLKPILSTKIVLISTYKTDDQITNFGQFYCFRIVFAMWQTIEMPHFVCVHVHCCARKT